MFVLGTKSPSYRSEHRSFVLVHRRVGGGLPSALFSFSSLAGRFRTCRAESWSRSREIVPTFRPDFRSCNLQIRRRKLRIRYFGCGFLYSKQMLWYGYRDFFNAEGAEVRKMRNLLEKLIGNFHIFPTSAPSALKIPHSTFTLCTLHSALHRIDMGRCSKSSSVGWVNSSERPSRVISSTA